MRQVNSRFLRWVGYEGSGPHGKVAIQFKDDDVGPEESDICDFLGRTELFGGDISEIRKKAETAHGAVAEVDTATNPCKKVNTGRRERQIRQWINHAMSSGNNQIRCQEGAGASEKDPIRRCIHLTDCIPRMTTGRKELSLIVTNDTGHQLLGQDWRHFAARKKKSSGNANHIAREQHTTLTSIDAGDVSRRLRF